MKRKISIVIMLIILSFTVISCGAKEYELTLTKNTQIENADDIVMTIKDKSDKELDLVIENKTDDEYVYGYVFELEVEKDENWYRVPFKDNVAFIEIGIILKPKSNNNENIKLDTCFGELKKGSKWILSSGTPSSDKDFFTLFINGGGPQK